jgi:hypothetical protein
MVVNTERVDITVTEREIVTSGEVPTALPDGPLAAVLLAAGIGAFALYEIRVITAAMTAMARRATSGNGCGV